MSSPNDTNKPCNQMKRSLTLVLSAVVAFCVAEAAPAQVVNFAPPGTIKKFPFYPQGGNFFQDLFPTNFVDLDTTGGILAYNGSDYTYDTHNGCDTDIDGFTAQAIGVPIFAALDGTVIAAHDGEFDMNTMFNSSPPNFVKIDHGNGQTTLYDHLKKGSVAVVVGQQVTAGQQIGLTASSGNSTAPHLHFQCELNSELYEPFSGSARQGVSGWVTQPPFRTDVYVRQFVITSQDLTSFAGPPFDTTRKGTFFTGLQTINTWFQFGNGEPIRSLTVSFLRPNGTVAFTTTSNFGSFSRNGFSSYDFNLDLDVVGTWKLQLKVNGSVLAAAPFAVVASGSTIANHAPAAVTAVFDPATPDFTGATFCRITSPTLFLDPDYDFVRYHYVWKVNGTVVRDVISAGLADAIPNNLGHAGDDLTCVVTPGDGVADGPATTVTTVVQSVQTLLNISTRLKVLAGDKVLIGGFIITGSEPKKVVLRALGPSLGGAGVSGALADPVLALHKPDGSIVTNDNWKATQENAIIASGVPPTNDLESAIVATLAPGSYTAVVSGKNGGTGIGLIEVYDLAPAAGALANISTRGFVDTGDNVLIGGFIVGGGDAGTDATVLVRAIGASLVPAGVTDALLDTTLELHDANGLILRSNDNWMDTQQAVIEATTIPPTNDKESALVETLAPGNYTAIVRGKNSTTGVALVEVYNLR